jgi:hypothetical protein
VAEILKQIYFEFKASQSKMTSFPTKDKNRNKRKLELQGERDALYEKARKIDEELQIMTTQDKCDIILYEMQSVLYEIEKAWRGPSVLIQIIFDYQKSWIFHVFLKCSREANYLRALPVSKLLGLQLIEDSRRWSYGYAVGNEDSPDTTTFPVPFDHDEGACPLEQCTRKNKDTFGLCYQNARWNSIIHSIIADSVELHIGDYEKACNEEEWKKWGNAHHAHYLIPGAELFILCYSETLEQQMAWICESLFE